MGAVCLAGALGVAATSGPAPAYTLTLAPASPKTIYLQVGVGSFTANYNAGGQPGNNATVNTVSTTVAASAVGNGTPQPMTTDSTAAKSFLDGYAYCSVPGQLYIGGFYRTAGGSPPPPPVPGPGAPGPAHSPPPPVPFFQLPGPSNPPISSTPRPFPPAHL